MRNGYLVVAIIAGLAGAPSTPSTVYAGVTDTDGTRIAVRTYDTAGLDPARRHESLAAAGRILEAAGVRVAWIVCDGDIPEDIAARCASLVEADELIVRFVRLPAGRRTAQVALGHAMVDASARSGVLATIFVDRVVAFVAASGASVETTLGRATAHEIGHLLLGNTHHARSGVMRAVWTVGSLLSGSPSDWLFTSTDAAALRTAIRGRSARPFASRAPGN